MSDDNKPQQPQADSACAESAPSMCQSDPIALMQQWRLEHSNLMACIRQVASDVRELLGDNDKEQEHE